MFIKSVDLRTVVLALLLNNARRYGLIHQFLHWVTAPLIIGVYAIGLWMNDLDYYSAYYQSAPMLHKTVAVVITILMLFRLIWKCLNRPVRPLNGLKVVEQRLASFTHLAMYGVIFMLALTAYLFSTADGTALGLWFGIEVPAISGLAMSGKWIDRLGLAHEWLAHALALMIILHVSAVVKHAFIDKQKVLSRMFGTGPK